MASRYNGEAPKLLDALQFQEPSGCFVVAEVDDMPLACGGFRAVDSETAELKLIRVEPAMRRQGLGRLVLDFLETEASKLGYRRLILETGLAQPEALALYEACGYSPSPTFGEFKGYPDVRAFTKDLGEPASPNVDSGGSATLRSRGYVDYEQVADLYRRGRSLPPEVLDRWACAIRPYLPSGPLTLVDIGAGTGIFAGAWPGWAKAKVIAVEPAEAMAQVAVVADRDVSFLRAVAEDLPLRDDGSDVVWVSTALHHFADVDRAVSEFARVLRVGGRVLVRTYVPGRTEITYADEFPGRSKWISRFHDEERLLRIFGVHRFNVVDVREVLEWAEPYAASAEWVSMMRDADSMLTALTDEEIQAGLDALRSNPGKIGRLELTLLVFEHL